MKPPLSKLVIPRFPLIHGDVPPRERWPQSLAILIGTRPQGQLTISRWHSDVWMKAIRVSRRD